MAYLPFDATHELAGLPRMPGAQRSGSHVSDAWAEDTLTQPYAAPTTWKASGARVPVLTALTMAEYATGGRAGPGFTDTLLRQGWSSMDYDAGESTGDGLHWDAGMYAVPPSNAQPPVDAPTPPARMHAPHTINGATRAPLKCPEFPQPSGRVRKRRCSKRQTTFMTWPTIQPSVRTSTVHRRSTRALYR